MSDNNKSTKKWSPSVGNALHTRATLINLIREAEVKVYAIDGIRKAISLIAVHRKDESMQALCDGLRSQIESLWEELVKADRSDQTEVIVREQSNG